MSLRTATGPLSDQDLLAWYAVDHPEWVRGSFITTLDGRATGPGGLSGGLNEGSTGDHHVFHRIRDWADAVIVGAGTVRAEGYGPLERTPLVVVTRSGRLPHQIEQAAAATQAGENEGVAGSAGAGDEERVSGPTREGEISRRGEVVILGGHGQDVSPALVVAQCHRRGWRRLVVEGGPELFGGFLQAGLVDELCVTIRPVLFGGDGPLLVPPTVQAGGLPGRATHLLTWDGDLLLRTSLT